MAVDLEKIVLNGISFNDQVKLSMEALTFIPAQAKPKLAENPNADGVVLVEEPQFTPAYFEMMVRVVNVKNTDEALATIGDVMDALMSCARTEGGSEVEWTPNEANTTYAAYALFGELLEIPITVTGELAGWFVDFPILKIKLTCRPFLFVDERVVKTLVESSEQFQTVYIKEIGGDVPAEARIVITDKAAKRRRYIEWGQDVVESEVNPAIQIKATSLTTTGFAGESGSTGGSISATVVKATVVAIPVTICSTGSIANLGTYRGKLRVWGTAGVSLRISYRVGDGPLTSRNWIEVSQAEQWVELDMKEIFLDEVERGEQVSQILIEGKTSSVSSVIYIDVLSLMPTRRYAVARGPADFSTPSVLNAYDLFNQTAGNLAGKVAEIGGTWSGVGDADDFTIDTGFHAAKRTALNDTLNIPRYEILGANEYTNIFVSVNVTSTNPSESSLVQTAASYLGILARYIDTNNWVKFQFYSAGAHGLHESPWEAEMFWYCAIWKKVAGVITLVKLVEKIGGGAIRTAHNGTWVTAKIGLLVLEDGTWSVFVDDQKLATGADAALETGGAIAKGKIGLVDEKRNAVADTRYYDNFTAFTPTVGIVCNSSKAVEMRTTEAQFENSTGKYWSPVPEYRGADLYLDPVGPDNLLNRVVVKTRRNDIKVEPDTVVNDKQGLEVFARERFLAPR